MIDLVNQMCARAKECGLTDDEVKGFPAWVGNEIFEGREVADLRVLLERTQELVNIFKAEKASKNS